MTAGASAPEVLVDRVTEAIGGLGPVTVEERAVVQEAMRFTIPVELRHPGERGGGRGGNGANGRTGEDSEMMSPWQ